MPGHSPDEGTKRPGHTHVGPRSAETNQFQSSGLFLTVWVEETSRRPGAPARAFPKKGAARRTPKASSDPPFFFLAKKFLPPGPARAGGRMSVDRRSVLAPGFRRMGKNTRQPPSRLHPRLLEDWLIWEFVSSDSSATAPGLHGIPTFDPRTDCLQRTARRICWNPPAVKRDVVTLRPSIRVSRWCHGCKSSIGNGTLICGTSC